MAIDGVKVTPPKISSYGDMFQAMRDKEAIADKERIEVSIRGGLGNKTLYQYGGYGYSKGSKEDKMSFVSMHHTADPVEQYVDFVKEKNNQYERAQIEAKKNAFTLLLKWIKLQVLSYVLNYTWNEKHYEKIVNFILDNMNFDEEAKSL